MRIEIKLSRAEITDAAMRRSGLSPKAMALKPGTRRMRDKKSCEKRGYQKHRGHSFD